MASLASDASSAFANAYLNVDIPLDGIGLISIPAAEIISPVFTLWITLVIMYMGTRQTTSSHVPKMCLMQSLLFASGSLMTLFSNLFRGRQHLRVFRAHDHWVTLDCHIRPFGNSTTGSMSRALARMLMVLLAVYVWVVETVESLAAGVQ